MKTAFLFILFFSLEAFGQISKDITDPKLRKKVEKIEKEAIRKSKVIEEEMRAGTANNKAAQDLFRLKDSVTEKKIILGEEVEVLKNTSTLLREAKEKRKSIVNAWRKSQKTSLAPQVTQMSENNLIEYPLPVSANNQLFYRQSKLKVETPAGKNRPYVIVIINLVIISGLILLWIKKRSSK